MAEPLTPQQELEREFVQTIIRAGAPYHLAFVALRKVVINMIAMIDADEEIDEREVAGVASTFAPALLRKAKQFVRMIRERQRTRRAAH